VAEEKDAEFTEEKDNEGEDKSQDAKGPEAGAYTRPLLSST
jgi:hypothetical protein